MGEVPIGRRRRRHLLSFPILFAATNCCNGGKQTRERRRPFQKTGIKRSHATTWGGPSNRRSLQRTKGFKTSGFLTHRIWRRGKTLRETERKGSANWVISGSGIEAVIPHFKVPCPTMKLPQRVYGLDGGAKNELSMNLLEKSGGRGTICTGTVRRPTVSATVAQCWRKNSITLGPNPPFFKRQSRRPRNNSCILRNRGGSGKVSFLFSVSSESLRWKVRFSLQRRKKGLKFHKLFTGNRGKRKIFNNGDFFSPTSRRSSYKGGAWLGLILPLSAYGRHFMQIFGLREEKRGEKKGQEKD